MNLDQARIRPARPADAQRLSALAMRSKATWGYDAAFMEACRDELTLDEVYLKADPTYLLESGCRCLGFYSLEPLGTDGSRGAELGMFFVEPEFIGKGVGRRLMADALNRASSKGFIRLIVQSDPQAEPFYRAMGFVRTGDRMSASLPGRRLPMLECRLPAGR